MCVCVCVCDPSMRLFAFHRVLKTWKRYESKYFLSNNG